MYIGLRIFDVKAGQIRSIRIQSILSKKKVMKTGRGKKCIHNLCRQNAIVGARTKRVGAPKHNFSFRSTLSPRARG